MGVTSLFDQAKIRLIANIHMLSDIGDLPYAFLAPVLRCVKNPDQLMELEANCPQLLGETGELWLKIIKRDIPNYAKKPHEPRDPKNWGKVYRKLKRESEQEEEQQKNALKEQLQALQNNRKGQQTTIIEGRISQAPSARRKGFSFSGGAYGRSAAPAKTGKVAFDAVKRSIFDQKQARPKASMMPAHMLADRKRTVAQAPAAMIRQAARAEVNEGPQRMVLSKAASASVAARKASAPITSRPPNITSRPMARPSAASPPKPTPRVKLPEGQSFSAPKLEPAVKRRREEPGRVFHEQKRRKP
jgi:elongin-A